VISISGRYETKNPLQAEERIWWLLREVHWICALVKTGVRDVASFPLIEERAYEIK
jgi:hypothetical protein